MSKEKPRCEADLIEDELPGSDRLAQMPIRTMEQLDHNRRKGPPVIKHRLNEWEDPEEQPDIMRPLVDRKHADDAFWSSLSGGRLRFAASEQTKADAQQADADFFRSLKQRKRLEELS